MPRRKQPPSPDVQISPSKKKTDDTIADFNATAERLRKLNRPPYSDEDMGAIVDLWIGYPPLLFALIGPHSIHDKSRHSAIHRALHLAHLEAVECLARLAESEGIYGEDIRTSGHLCGELMQNLDFLFSLDRFKNWPVCLGSAYDRLPGYQQREVDDAEKAISELRRKFSENTPPPNCPLKIDAGKVLVNGSPVLLNMTTDLVADVMTFLEALIAEHGNWISSSEIDANEKKKPSGRPGVRWDRIR